MPSQKSAPSGPLINIFLCVTLRPFTGPRRYFYYFSFCKSVANYVQLADSSTNKKLAEDRVKAARSGAQRKKIPANNRSAARFTSEDPLGANNS